MEGKSVNGCPVFLTCLFREQGLKNTVKDKEFCFFPSFVFQGGRTGVVTGLYLFQVFHQKGKWVEKGSYQGSSERLKH